MGYPRGWSFVKLGFTCYKRGHSRGKAKSICIKEKHNISSEALCETLYASRHLFDTCEPSAVVLCFFGSDLSKAVKGCWLPVSSKDHQF